MNKENPYYSPEKLGLVQFSLDQGNMSYEFNTFCVWITPDKQIYAESDSGCSCPTPFEDYEAATLDEFKQKVTRYENVASVVSAINNWNNEIYDAQDRCSQSEIQKVEEQIKAALA
jgi:hypothetical protein